MIDEIHSLTKALDEWRAGTPQQYAKDKADRLHKELCLSEERDNMRDKTQGGLRHFNYNKWAQRRGSATV